MEQHRNSLQPGYRLHWYLIQKILGQGGFGQVKKKCPTAKVIMITGVDDKETVEKAKKLGADDYITKPLVLEYLESTVMNKIKNLSPAR